MTAVLDDSGKWVVVVGRNMLAGPFDTMAEAWRWIDRYTGDPVSRLEKTAESAWNQSVDRSFG